MPDANQLLREDHRKVKELFREFERTDDKRRKREIANRAIRELEVHTKIEEDIYYPAVRKQDDEGATDLVAEAEEEHAVVERLATQLKKRRSVDDEFEAKFKVMAENVKHHIEEEEMQMLPMAAEKGMDRLRKLGEEMQLEKARLMGASPNGSRTARSPSRAKAARATRSRSGTAGSRSKTARKPGTRKTKPARTGTRTTTTRKTRVAARTLSRSKGKTPQTRAAGRTLAKSSGTARKKSKSGARSTARKR